MICVCIGLVNTDYSKQCNASSLFYCVQSVQPVSCVQHNIHHCPVCACVCKVTAELQQAELKMVLKGQSLSPVVLSST